MGRMKQSHRQHKTLFTMPQRSWCGQNRKSGVRIRVHSGDEGVENGGNLGSRYAEDWKKFTEAGFLDEAVMKRRDEEAVMQKSKEKISRLKKELYEYQFNMGLLLIEKKDWNSTYIELNQDLVEVKDALSEAEKREENLRNALVVERECVLDLVKALREMKSEHAEISFAADSKCDSVRMNLDLKEKELSAWEEKLNAREKVGIQKLVDDHSAALDAKKREFEIELEEKRKSFEDGLRNRLVEVEKKEGEVNQMEEKVAKREQALEKRAEKLKEKEKEHEVKVKALKEREKSMKSEEKDLGKEKGKIESEREELLGLKAEVEKLRASNEEELLRTKEETKHLQVTEEERSEYLRLRLQLKHEIDQCRHQKELLMKEAGDLSQQKEETFEREWDELDLKLKERQVTENYLQRELETLKLAKESFAAEIVLEKSILAEKAQNEKNQMLLNFEMRRKELEGNMQNQLELKEKDLFELRKLFEEKRESELNNINFLREVANREMEEMKHQRSKLEKEKQEAYENRDHIERQRIELQHDIDIIINLKKKLKNQREQFIVEKSRFIDVFEKLQSCLNYGEMTSEFVLSTLQSSADIENLEVPSLPKLVGDITRGGSDVNLESSRLNTVKDVIKEAEAILGELKAAEAVPGEFVDDRRDTDFPNGIAGDSENQKPPERRTENLRKRTWVQTSQVTANGHEGDDSEGRSDIPGKPKRRQEKAAAPPAQTAGECTFASSIALSEVNGMADEVELHDAEYRSGSRGEDAG